MNNLLEPKSNQIIFYGIEDFFKPKDKFKDKTGAKDFREEQKAARVWGEHKFKNWTRRLDESERTAVTGYTKFSRELNFYLREYKNPLEEKDMPEEMKEKYKDNNNKIKALDSALAKMSTEKPMHVYRRVELPQFYSAKQIQDEGLELRKGTVINRDLAMRIVQDFVKYQHEYRDPSYVSTSLSQDPPASKSMFYSRPILLKIRLPQGAHAGYIGGIADPSYREQNEVLIARNYIFKYRNATIITVDGLEVLQVEMDAITPNKKPN